MLRLIIFLFLFFYNLPSFSNNNKLFLMLKNNKVQNVRYGPSFDYPLNMFYKKIFACKSD